MSTEKRRGRTPAKLNVSKPGVGMAYIAKAKKNGKSHVIRIATTCARDTNPAKDGELTGMLSNFTSGCPGNGEKYFTAKVGRKGEFRYFVFLCDDRHKKCMGFEAKPKDIPSKITSVMNALAKTDVKKDDQGRLIITDFVGDLEYEWLDMSYQDALAKGTKVYKMVGDDFVIIDPEAKVKPAKKEKVAKVAKAEKPAKAEKAAKKTKVKKTKVEAKPAAEVAKETGAVKPKKTDNRKTWYGIKDGEIVSRRVVKKPEGFFASREEAEAALAAAVKLLNSQVDVVAAESAPEVTEAPAESAAAE